MPTIKPEDFDGDKVKLVAAQKELKRMVKCWNDSNAEVERLRKENEQCADTLDECCASLNDSNDKLRRARELLDKARGYLVLADPESGEMFDKISALLDGEK